ncbi:hypothetical protein ACUW1Y_000195 [Escherichia coli]
MAFSKPMLPDRGLNSALENALMQQWETGYKDGVESCATMLEVIANTLMEKGNKELAELLDSIGQNFREQVKNA